MILIIAVGYRIEEVIDGRAEFLDSRVPIHPPIELIRVP
jgi:hypothetical protein